jgi:hypothetical protein
MANEMKTELRQISASTSEATIRQHQIDRPAAKGGDAGPMRGELFLAAVGAAAQITAGGKE